MSMRRLELMRTSFAISSRRKMKEEINSKVEYVRSRDWAMEI